MLLLFCLLATAVAVNASQYQITADAVHYTKFPFMNLAVAGINPDNQTWVWQLTSGWEKLEEKLYPTVPHVTYENSIEIAPYTLYYLAKDQRVHERVVDDDPVNWGGNLTSVPSTYQYYDAFTRGFVGLAADGSCWHRSPFSSQNEDESKAWTNIGGDFSVPTTAIAYRNSSAEVEVHFFGVSKSNKLLHKTLSMESQDDVWIPNIKEWAVVDNGAYKDGVALSRLKQQASAQEGEDYSLWALKSTGSLLHKRFKASKSSDWEELGGSWSQVPTPVEWRKNEYIVVGHNQTDKNYWLKSYDGTSWTTSWKNIGGEFDSSPAIIASRAPGPYYVVLGVAKNGSLSIQPQGSGFSNPDNQWSGVGNASDIESLRVNKLTSESQFVLSDEGINHDEEL